MIEIMVAVAIIALLTAVSFSHISRTRNTTKVFALMESVERLKQAIDLYENE